MIYSIHPCLICGELTNNKTYCKTHGTAFKKPFVYIPSQVLIFAEESLNNRERRRVGGYHLKGVRG